MPVRINDLRIDKMGCLIGHAYYFRLVGSALEEGPTARGEPIEFDVGCEQLVGDGVRFKCDNFGIWRLPTHDDGVIANIRANIDAQLCAVHAAANIMC